MINEIKGGKAIFPNPPQKLRPEKKIEHSFKGIACMSEKESEMEFTETLLKREEEDGESRGVEQ